jgi:hypothetical protein
VNRRFREIALQKSGETYLFRFDGASRKALLAVLAQYATRSDLSFSWHDAAVVCRKAREECGQGLGGGLCAPAMDRFR